MGYRPKNFPDSSTPLFEPKRERQGNYLPFIVAKIQTKKKTNKLYHYIFAKDVIF